MNDAGYRKRLSTDLPKWLDRGWVTTDGAAAILASLPGRARTAFGLAGVMGTLGALLLGLGVLAFIAANWDAMPRMVRLGLIAAAMIVAYVAAFEFDRRRLRVFAEAGILAAGLVYAGAIALVGQTYHMAGDFEGAILLFEVGIVGAALFTGSATLNILGLVASAYWVWLGTVETGVAPHWASLIAILVGIAVATVHNAHYGRIVAVIALIFWLGVTIGGFADRYGWRAMDGALVSVSVMLALWALGAALASFRRGRLARLGDAMLWPSLVVLLLLLGATQAVDRPAVGSFELVAAACTGIVLALILATIAYARRSLTLGDLIALIAIALGMLAFALYTPADDLPQRLTGGILVMIAALWAVYQGQTGTHRVGKALGLAAFGLETFYLYVVTLGTMLDTALAFLGGGVLFIVLAAVLYRIDRRLAARPVPAIAETPEMTAPPPPLAMADEDTGADKFPAPPLAGDGGDERDDDDDDGGDEDGRGGGR